MTTTVYAHGLCYLSACSDGLNDEVTDDVNMSHPTGLDHGWSIADEPFASGDSNPTMCPDYPGYRHFLFSC